MLLPTHNTFSIVPGNNAYYSYDTMKDPDRAKSGLIFKW